MLFHEFRHVDAHHRLFAVEQEFGERLAQLGLADAGGPHIGRSGHPCGEDFKVAPFLKAHPEFDYQQSILNDMIAGPWTTFTANQKSPSIAAGN